ncbi:uncharacterized protein LOC112568029 [Pomacea canaliculata]|uniref:uncharacterized protein LOC112568029 n=1 Tax=Pomacea canaliculata TaxID=400727 RepID=UPI000D72BB06|nr:uncharacterized protein LOC112568029 [Pomacea canaliculata]
MPHQCRLPGKNFLRPKFCIRLGTCNMRGIFLLLLLSVSQPGSTETECETIDEMDLQCKFVENINSTQKEFSVYFYSENGVEEVLVDCTWNDGKLDCIEQQGVKFVQPVSNYAVISIPTRFTNTTGHYKCKSFGERLDTIKPCSFLESKGQKQYATCEVNTFLGMNLLFVNCTFPIEVDSFIVEVDTTIVGNFTKLDCKEQHSCRYQTGNSGDIFTVRVDPPQRPYNQCRCVPAHTKIQIDVKGCPVSQTTDCKNMPKPGGSAVLLVVIISIACVIAVVTGLFIYRIRKQKFKSKTQSTALEFCGNALINQTYV